MSSIIVSYDELSSFGIRYCRMHLARLERAGKFPRRIQISENRIAWLRSEIDAWIAAKAAARDAA